MTPPDSPKDQSPLIDALEPEKRTMRSHLLWGYRGIVRNRATADWLAMLAASPLAEGQSAPVRKEGE